MSAIKKPSYEYYHGKTASDIDYDEFVEQLALDDIYLNSCRLKKYGSAGGGLSTVPISSSAWWYGESDWEAYDSGLPNDGFEVHYKVVAEVKSNDGERIARIEAEYALDYLSFVPMDNEAFETFSETTVPLNVWPYLREFLSSITSRAGLGPYILPGRMVPAISEREEDGTEAG